MTSRQRSADSATGKLKLAVLRLASCAREAAADAVHAFVRGDADMAVRAVAANGMAREAYVGLERRCWSLPRRDLGKDDVLHNRLFYLNVSLDLLGAANYGASIAATCLELMTTQPGLRLHVPLSSVDRLGTLSLALLDLSIEAVAREDIQRARSVLELAGHIEALYRKTLDPLPTYITRNGQVNVQYAYLARVVRPMERLGDRALSIAEQVLLRRSGPSSSPLTERDLDLAA